MLTKDTEKNNICLVVAHCISILKDLDDEVQFLLDTIDPLVQSGHPLVHFTQDRGLRRLEVSDLVTVLIFRRVRSVPW